MNANPNNVSRLIAVLSVAAALKLHYSTAGVGDLLWILAPTTALVELLTGVDFTYEAHAGYMSSDHSFLIAPVCAGVNFLITAFVLLSIQTMFISRAKVVAWRFLPVAIVAAYLTTIVANAVRISTALRIRRLDPDLFGLNPDQLHRFEGIFVYFGFLLLLFVAGERLNPAQRSAPGGWRRWMLPILIYYAATLGVPLVNGAYYRDPADFLEHSLFVLLTPILVLLPVIAFGLLRNAPSQMRIRRLS